MYKNNMCFILCNLSLFVIEMVVILTCFLQQDVDRLAFHIAVYNSTFDVQSLMILMLELT